MYDSKKHDPFCASWRFLRYKDYELINISDEEFDRWARQDAAAGFTHLITFGGTHFRWSYRRFFPKLTENLRRLTEAYHRHGLLVVEHHSACLTWNYDTSEKREEILRYSDAKFWPCLEEDMQEDSVYNGVTFREMQQVSGLTGKPFISFMNAYILCHNNPDYRRFYLDYLDTLYDVGIDGIMTDDIQFVSALNSIGKNGEADFDINSCACYACRAKFKEKTGYDLPEPGDEWRSFIKDQYAPRFIAWKRFRYESSLDFHKAVVERYEARGLRMLRPNYTATSVAWVSPWAFVFDELPRLDWGFVEHCCGIIRYSWPEYVFESIHCNMITRQRNIPALALYYPQAADAQIFSWALSLYSGQRYLGDPVNPELIADQIEFHRYENEHFNALFHVRENTFLAFYDSQMGRELDPEYNTTVRNRFNSWAQACIHGNLQWTMVNANHPEEFNEYKVIVVPGTRFMSDAEITALVLFAEEGGKLVWCDQAGSYDVDSGKKRTVEKLMHLLAPAEKNLIHISEVDYPGRFTKRCRVKDNSDRDAFDCSEPNRWRPLSEEEKKQHNDIVDFLSRLLPRGREIKLSSSHEEDLLVSSYYSAGNNILSIRFANAAQTLQEPEEKGFGEFDPIPFPARKEPLCVSVRCPAAFIGKKLQSIAVSSLHEEIFDVPFVYKDGYYVFELPAGLPEKFALAELYFS